MDDFDVAGATQGPSQPTRPSCAIRPVTIRQLTQTKIREELTRNGSEFRYSLDGDDFCAATFVGNIISYVVSGENTRTIRIDDGTAKITSKTRRNQEVEDPPKWRVGDYVRVFGVPHKFNEAVVFNIYFIRPVDDPHEVFFHLMEAIAVTLQHSRGQPPPRLYDSEFAIATTPPLPQLTPDPDLSVSMQSLVLDYPPLSAASTSQVTDDPPEDSSDSVSAESSGWASGDTSDDNDDDGGSTEYYTD
ncbi:hypothetical protein BDM02DRAFT_3112743 [Thelephora ganbajun]|uniref:Uncharacterized protein n=1 Tax=Thelephora ganbajun TaxID=370292 RepID=A0ACB6ZKC8_THEGA|nr:hypothetical protein BDM02DRAFT_3112743 [Thelephora ganbajun]